MNFVRPSQEWPSHSHNPIHHGSTTSTLQDHHHDDKSPHCIPFILSRLQIHRAHHPDVPFFIGLNGVQGAGKTTLVSALAETLQQKEGLETLVCSIDDLYLKHEDQVALAAARPDNQLVQHRGEPGRSCLVFSSSCLFYTSQLRRRACS